jgi:hypothetical protein
MLKSEKILEDVAKQESLELLRGELGLEDGDDLEPAGGVVGDVALNVHSPPNSK